MSEPNTAFSRPFRDGQQARRAPNKTWHRPFFTSDRKRERNLLFLAVRRLVSFFFLSLSFFFLHIFAFVLLSSLFPAVTSKNKLWSDYLAVNVVPTLMRIATRFLAVKHRPRFTPASRKRMHKSRSHNTKFSAQCSLKNRFTGGGRG